MKTIDLTGQTFGRLTVLRRGANRHSKTAWLCLCTCGNHTHVLSRSLRTGETQSCGCLMLEKMRERGFSALNASCHRMSETSEYRIWTLMRRRCSDQKNQRYGGRGIRVCDRWDKSFENFFADMGSRPSPKHSIDRIDNDGNYEPDNCRWATPSEQANNTSTNRRLTHDGRTQGLRQWATELRIDERVIHARLKAGWDVSRALTVRVRRPVPESMAHMINACAFLSEAG